MKHILKCIFVFVWMLCLTSIESNATHVVGGEIYYNYLGDDQYEIVLKVYRDCGPTNVNGTGFDVNASVGIFSTESGEIFISDFFMDLSSAEVDFVPIELENPCFILPPDVCVERAVYSSVIELPAIPGGYTLVYQRCCRNPSIVNLDFPQDQGATFTTHIPGSDEVGEINSSAQFTLFPPVALCQNAEFFFDHSATDEDGDSLVYEFCPSYLGGTTGVPAPVPPEGPPFFELNYANGFSYEYPIASDPAFAIDPITGYITGTATELGQYVMGICVSEFRDGVLINTSNRDFQFNVTICDPNIISSIPEQTDFCLGQTIQFENNSTNASFYHWDFGVASIDTDTSSLQNPSYTYGEAGIYQVTLIANPGWPCADTSQTSFSALPVISPAIVVGDYECVNGHDLYDFSFTSNASANATYQWDFGVGSIPQTSVALSPQNIMMNPEALQMNISLNVQDNGCEESDTESINNPPDPEANILPQEVFCNGFDFSFECESENTSTFLWNFGTDGGGDFSSLQTPQFTYSDTGHYEVTLIVSAPFTCNDTSYQEVRVYGLLTANYPQQNTQCLEGNHFDFQAIGASSNQAEYFWDFGPSAIPSTSNQQNPQHIVFTEPHSHTVSLTISENGCTETYIDSLLVSDHLITDLAINDSDGCEPWTVDLDATVQSDVPVYFMWNFGDGNSSMQGETTHTYEYPGTYDVTVQVFTLQGCADTLTQEFPAAVVVHPRPIAGFTMTPQVVNILDSEMAIADSSWGSVSCFYAMSDGGTSNECDFNYSWLTSGFQTITQYVESEFGCKDHIEGTVIVEGFVFYAPNSFTPDNDGLNDEWAPKMTGITNYDLKIFNRWGDLIHESNDKEKPWLGQVNGGDHFAENGVYNYVIHVDDLVGLPHEFTGHITLVR